VGVEIVSICGWTGKILRVDLSSGKISHLDTAQYVPKFIGGLGIAAKIAWDELRPGVGPFDPENMLMIMAGPLTGTLASGAGRVEVVGIAPQQRPPVFSRSGMGGHWGAELKYAGFDGIVVGGVSAKPVYVWIDNSKVEIRDAGELWGTGTYSTTMVLRAIHGPKTRVVSCGQAGENLSRIAVIQTETGNAAGQGGYGGVMGSKRLKAIAVRGTKGVKVARPAEFLELCLGASREGQSPSRSRSAPDLVLANLSAVNLENATLGGANLRRATLVETSFEGADLSGCRIYGISAWELRLEGAIQTNLIITPADQPTITVDNLKVAQFIYLLLNNERVRQVIDTLTSKVVLILGRFTPER